MSAAKWMQNKLIAPNLKYGDIASCRAFVIWACYTLILNNLHQRITFYIQYLNIIAWPSTDMSRYKNFIFWQPCEHLKQLRTQHNTQRPEYYHVQVSWWFLINKLYGLTIFPILSGTYFLENHFIIFYFHHCQWNHSNLRGQCSSNTSGCVLQAWQIPNPPQCFDPHMHIEGIVGLAVMAVMADRVEREVISK